MPADEARRCVDVDDAAVVDDGDAIAQPLCLLHEVSGHEDRLAALADAAHQVPDGAPGLRIEPGGELVEEHELRVVDQGERDEQPLLLASRERHEPGVPLLRQAELIEQPIGVHRLRVQRCPQVERLPDLDPLLQLRFLELDADPILQFVNVVRRIQRQH